MSYLQTLSIAKLFQFGLQLPTGRQTYIYSMTQADRLAISNVAIQSNHNTINIITIALNIFLLDASVIKTKMLAFTKLNNGHKFITYTQNKKLKYKPFEALENTIRRSDNPIPEHGFMIDAQNVYQYVKNIYKAYEALIQQSIDGDNVHQVILSAMLELQVYSDPNTPVLMNPLNTENICTFWIKIRSASCQSLFVGFSFVVVSYMTAEIEILSFGC